MTALPILKGIVIELVTLNAYYASQKAISTGRDTATGADSDAGNSTRPRAWARRSAGAQPLSGRTKSAFRPGNSGHQGDCMGDGSCRLRSSVLAELSSARRFSGPPGPIRAMAL